MLFSIIVPIYNVEKYLPKCIESVLQQTYSDFELILVNDGSPDNSGIICDEYAEKEKRIRVIHKKNGGLSDARNAGLSIANGEFIWFLDSDDFMATSAISKVVDIIERNQDVDMITCAHYNEYSDGITEVKLLPFETSITSISRNDFLMKLYKSNGSYFSAWRNIYRKSVIEKNNLQFVKGLIGAEDCDFFIRFIRCGEKFTFLNTPVVHYRIDREDSITNVMSKSAIMGQLTVFGDNYNISIKDMDYKNQNMKVFFANKFANTVFLVHHMANKQDIDEVVIYINNHKNILRDARGIKYDISKLIWKLFGYYKGSRLLKRIKLR